MNKIFKTFIQVKEDIVQNEFRKTFVLIGCIAAIGCVIFLIGKQVGSWIATF